MGREQIRTWKYLYLCITSVIFISFAGCATLKEIEIKREARQNLITAQKLIAIGDYEGSLKENQKVISLSGNKPFADEALFNMALIYSHYGYPKRDYKKSLALFRRLVKEYPQSPLCEQAKIWLGVLEVIEKTKQVDIEIEEKKKEFSR